MEIFKWIPPGQDKCNSTDFEYLKEDEDIYITHAWDTDDGRAVVSKQAIIEFVKHLEKELK